MLLDGPGLVNFDFAVARSFECFGEGRRLEFRWEMFNMFNTPQFGLPERNRSSSSAGRISTLAGDPRVMQFANTQMKYRLGTVQIIQTMDGAPAAKTREVLSVSTSKPA